MLVRSDANRGANRMQMSGQVQCKRVVSTYATRWLSGVRFRIRCVWDPASAAPAETMNSPTLGIVSDLALAKRGSRAKRSLCEPRNWR